MTTTIPRRLLSVLAVGLVCALLMTGCMSDGQASVQNEMNADRQALRLRGLPTHQQLNDKAQAWAEHLARKGPPLVHSNLAAGAPSCWRSLGENVGYGPSVASIEDAYMRSPGHRKNIVDTRWTYVGVGHARNGSRIYTVQVFMQGC